MEGAAGGRALHHHHRRRQAHLEAVAGSEMPRQHPRARGLLAHQKAMAGHRLLQLMVMAGVDALKRRAEHRHRGPSLPQAALVNRGVDPLGQTAHDRPTGGTERRSEPPGHRQPMGGRTPGADHGDRSTPGQGAPETSPAPPVQTQRGSDEGGDSLRPAAIPRQKNPPTSGNLPGQRSQRLSPPGQPEAREGRHQPGMPALKGAEGLHRLGPGRLKAAEGADQGIQPHPADPRAATPEQPPETLALAPGARPRASDRARGVSPHSPRRDRPDEAPLNQVAHAQWMRTYVL